MVGVHPKVGPHLAARDERTYKCTSSHPYPEANNILSSIFLEGRMYIQSLFMIWRMCLKPGLRTPFLCQYVTLYRPTIIPCHFSYLLLNALPTALDRWRHQFSIGFGHQYVTALPNRWRLPVLCRRVAMLRGRGILNNRGCSRLSQLRSGAERKLLLQWYPCQLCYN